ncbi:hypothetical protein FR264_01475 [Vibrio vulnificus]|nr:hypothetical protein [Vibrio vulnificus]MCU8124185.1 hypothetical protein [Vibrio vulnificus]
MPYCRNALVITPEMNTRDVLSLLSRTKFNAERTVQCGANRNAFLIDNGMNNVRAVINEEVGLILFSCRYHQYIKVVEAIVEEFAVGQALTIGEWKV